MYNSSSKRIWWLLGGFLLLLLIVGIFSSGGVENLGANAAIIPLNGVIVTQSQGLFAEGVSSGDIVDSIQRANDMANVEVIILEINSPGGSAVATEEIVRAVKRSQKPVISYIRDFGASGGYWVAASTEHVVAHPASIVGSVGVNGANLGFAGLLEEYNITYHKTTAGKYKDIGSPFREMTQDEEDRLDLKLGLLHDYFVDDVAKLRNLDAKQLEEIRQADFYIGLQGIDLGLVDELGGQSEALVYAEKTLEIEAIPFRMEAEASLADLFAGVNVGVNYPILEESYGGFNLR